MREFSINVWTPNIEGRFGYGAYVWDDDIAGAFEQYGNQKQNFPITNSSGTQVQILSFNASKDDATYAYDKLQVASLQVLACVKV